MPTDFVSLACAAATEERETRRCWCSACQGAPRHLPECAVHEEPPAPCDCRKPEA